MDFPNFKQKKTLLVLYRTEGICVYIECSPKYHPEIAVEGIKFCWGITKNSYYAKHLEEKRKENLLRLVREYTCNQLAIAMSTIRVF